MERVEGGGDGGGGGEWRWRPGLFIIGHLLHNLY